MNEPLYYLFVDRPDIKPRWQEFLCWDGAANAFVEFPSDLLAFPFTEAGAIQQDPEGRYTWIRCF